MCLSPFYQRRKWGKVKYLSNRIFIPLDAKIACFIILTAIVLKSPTLASTNDPKYNFIFFLMTQDRSHENVVILCCLLTSSVCSSSLSLSSGHQLLVLFESSSGKSCPALLLAERLLLYPSSHSFCSTKNPSKHVCYKTICLQCNKLWKMLVKQVMDWTWLKASGSGNSFRSRVPSCAGLDL